MVTVDKDRRAWGYTKIVAYNFFLYYSLQELAIKEMKINIFKPPTHEAQNIL